MLVAAAPVGAQVSSPGCPGPGPSVAGETTRALQERHRGLLSRLYSIGGVAVGPEVGAGGVLQAATFEGGYQFDSGDALAFVGSAGVPAFRDPVAGTFDAGGATTSVGLQYVAGLGRFVPASALARRSELGVGLAASAVGESGGVVAQVAPRVVVPLASFLSLPLGVQISQPLGGYEGARTFVGLSVGLRTQYVPPSRRVLDCDRTGLPRR
ncbi:hypothetical protein RQM47_09005 [Rubrivirga sp. S365]|uniref:Outer membrane protein beta-barrel domain-containing protein n=1 Tax=Rubrivirga litoralis TaxID=3075598 RepID=A0ABU3BUQ3_9BACT|nr:MULTISPECIES: hypothetical protein [unclassified Rubrivirga]MDT0633024.1 hypothetical protein [Rubrivirga sp. F394]MDT7856776.1 hypothetical protein [Rubrivirga sp. S365]